MPAGAVAVMAARRQQCRLRKNMQREQQLLEAERQALAETEKEAERLFAQFDVDEDGSLNEQELRALIRSLVPGPEVDEHTYLWLLSTSTAQLATTETVLPRSAMSALLSTTRAYVQNCGTAEEVLRKHGAGSRGSLDVGELLLALRDMAPPGVVVRAGDAVWLLRRYDTDGSLSLDAHELVHALSQWRKLAAYLSECSQMVGDDEEDDEPEDDEAAVAWIVGEVVAEPVEAVDGVPAADTPDPVATRIAERVHPLEGHRMLRKGIVKSLVRTLSGDVKVVENDDIKAAEKRVRQTVARRKADAARKAEGLPPKPSRTCALL